MTVIWAVKEQILKNPISGILSFVIRILMVAGSDSYLALNYSFDFVKFFPVLVFSTVPFFPQFLYQQHEICDHSDRYPFFYDCFYPMT
jgi:hypothetical protein